MATYGRRKKGLLSSFTVFRDNKGDKNAGEPGLSECLCELLCGQFDAMFLTAYERLREPRTSLQKSKNQGGLDDSSGDELGHNTVALAGSRQPNRLPPLQSVGHIAKDEIIRPESGKSADLMVEDINKPLPPVPPSKAPKDQSHNGQNRSALRNKSTNSKVSKPGAKRVVRPNISPPMLLETTNPAAHYLAIAGPTTGTTHSISSSKASRTKALELSRNVSTLMAEATSQEEQTRMRADIYAKESAQLSALERSKKAFVNASRLIKEQLNSGSHESSPKLKRPKANRHSSYHELGSLGSPMKYGLPQEISPARLDRRIAEGHNLSNPKIISITGDANIPRKPLPVYESMRSRSERSASVDDPFSDSKEPGSPVGNEEYSQSNPDSSESRDASKGERAKGIKLPSQAQVQIDASSKAMKEHTDIAQTPSRFSNMVSGLAQHPETMLFSSPPIGHSTPRTRLESQSTARDGLHDLNPLEHEASVSDPKSRYWDNEGASNSGGTCHSAKASDGSNLSIKRKGGTEDLRAQQALPTKKSKMDSADSEDDLGLTIGIRGLETGNERIPLSPKSSNKGDIRSGQNAYKRKGMSIFDLGKGKASERKDLDDGPEPRARSYPRRSSITLSRSKLFSRARGSRNGAHRYAELVSDSMDIDELQTDDAAFHIGAKSSAI